MTITNNARRVVDFSAYMQEAKARRIPRVLRIEDVEYPLPSGMPATVPLSLLAFQAQNGDGATPDATIVYPMLVDIFGKDQLDTIVVTHQMDMDDLSALLGMVMTMYGESPAIGTEGNAPAPVMPLTSLSTGG